ncbi:hypothetical protein LCGC14_1923360 [marine sediment metagenome]|uniref:Uncharacterized protein n=1 Tax=marine sediment metagenome TaxID=412755 RepID=A0A0F9FPW6_9ZZZZ
MPERIGNWPFTFPPATRLQDLKASDIYVLIRRAIADGQIVAQTAARTTAPGSPADMIASGLENRRDLLGG